jgi:hypothetical protein
MAYDKKHKHLDYIQATITRMASNSFLLKGWTITLVSAILALSGKDGGVGYMPVAYLPTVFFWWLDGYFLSQERLFRALFDNVAAIDVESEINYSMDTSLFYKGNRTLEESIKSKSLQIFYLGIIVVITACIVVCGIIMWFSQPVCE